MTTSNTTMTTYTPPSGNSGALNNQPHTQTTNTNDKSMTVAQEQFAKQAKQGVYSIDNSQALALREGNKEVSDRMQGNAQVRSKLHEGLLRMVNGSVSSLKAMQEKLESSEKITNEDIDEIAKRNIANKKAREDFEGALKVNVHLW